MHVLATHPDWVGTVAFDEFGQTTVIQKTPPMRPQDAPADYAPGDWSDDDTTRAASWFASEIGFEPSPGMLDAAIQAVIGARRFWPVRCAAIDLAAIERDRERLWAEAQAAYDAGEPWHLDTPDLRELAAQELGGAIAAKPDESADCLRRELALVRGDVDEPTDTQSAVLQRLLATGPLGGPWGESQG